MGSINVQGGGLDLRKYEPRQWAYPSVAIASANVWQTLLEVTNAEGYLSKVMCGNGDGTTTNDVRITIDGSVYGVFSRNGAGALGIATGENFDGNDSSGAISTFGADSIASGFLVYPFATFTKGASHVGVLQLSQPVFFKTGFKIEIRSTKTTSPLKPHVLGGIKI